jgi:hypothetical protein
MQTKFDEDGLPLATNHTGWNVEGFEGVYGWNIINDTPLDDKGDAKILCGQFQDKYPGSKFRVYEALTITR